jgi:hypothetical protein
MLQPGVLARSVAAVHVAMRRYVAIELTMEATVVLLELESGSRCPGSS